MRENLHCDCALSQRKYSIYSQRRTQVKAVNVGIKKTNHNLLQFHHLFGRSWGGGAHMSEVKDLNAKDLKVKDLK